MHYGENHTALRDFRASFCPKTVCANTKSKEQLRIFESGVKVLLGEEWQRFERVFEICKITMSEINSTIGAQKVFLWGASLQLEKILSQTTELNPNILGIIDKNPARWGEKIYEYTIFSPDILKETHVNAILLTIVNNNKSIYCSVEKFLQENHPNIKLLPQIFA